MADYDRRLQWLEHLAASTDERHYISREECQKRTAELLNSKEVLSLPLPEVTDEEWAAECEAWQAEHAEELAKARQFFASLGSGHNKR